MGVGEMGIGEMGQIIGETGVGEMGVGEMGVILFYLVAKVRMGSLMWISWFLVCDTCRQYS